MAKEPEPTEAAPSRGSRSLVGFYVATGVVVGLVGLGVLLAPVIHLHYHAWQYRRTQAPKHFAYVASALVAQRAPKARCVSLLGAPIATDAEFAAYWTRDFAPPEWDSCPISEYRCILLRDGRVVELAPPGYKDILVGPLTPDQLAAPGAVEVLKQIRGQEAPK